MKDIVIVGAGKIGSMIAEMLGGSRRLRGHGASTARSSSWTGSRPRRPIEKVAADITQGDALAQLADRQIRGAERRALSRDPPDRRGRQGGRRALPRPDRGCGQHARGQAAGRRRAHGASSRSAAWRRASSPSSRATWRAIRRAARRAHARRRAARISLERAQLQSDLEHRRGHQRVLRALRGDRQRPAARDAAAGGAARNSRSTAFCTKHSTPQAAWARCARRWPARCAISTTAPSAIPGHAAIMKALLQRPAAARPPRTAEGHSRERGADHAAGRGHRVRHRERHARRPADAGDLRATRSTPRRWAAECAAPSRSPPPAAFAPCSTC